MRGLFADQHVRSQGVRVRDDERFWRYGRVGSRFPPVGSECDVAALAGARPRHVAVCLPLFITVHPEFTIPLIYLWRA